MKKRIKLFTLLPLVASCLAATGCSLLDKNAKTYYFQNLSPDFQITTRKMKLFFPDGGNVPYVDIAKFVKDLRGYLISDYISVKKDINEKKMMMSFLIYGAIEIDWENDVIRGDSQFFNIIAMTSLSTNYSSNFKQNKDESDASQIRQVNFKLSDYGFDIKYENNKVLLPLVIANILFCSQNYYNVFFNGDKLYGTFGEVSDAQAMTLIKLTTPMCGTEIPEDVSNATLNSLAFLLDYFYGLKEIKGYTKAIDYIDANTKALITSPIGANNYRGITDFVFKTLNDLHSRVDFGTYYMDRDDSTTVPLARRGTKWNTYINLRNDLTAKRNIAEINPEINPVRFSGDTAIITFDNFVTGTKDQLNRASAWQYDTYKLMQYCMTRIKTHDEVKDIVVDLSLNSGGNLAALIRFLGFMTDDDVFYSVYNTLNNTYERAGFLIDTDEDGNYEDDAYKDYTWTILAGENTFSAANLAVSIVQEQGIAKVIGQKSGGGMCAVMPTVLADGTALTISSTMTLRQVRKEDGKNVYYPIEDGLDPDYEVEYANFYDDNKIVEAVDAVHGGN